MPDVRCQKGIRGQVSDGAGQKKSPKLTKFQLGANLVFLCLFVVGGSLSLKQRQNIRVEKIETAERSDNHDDERPDYGADDAGKKAENGFGQATIV